MKIFLVVFFITITDQLSKLIVKGFSIPFFGISIEGYPYGSRIPVIGEILNLIYVENPGIAFGIDFGGNYKLLISVLTVLITAGLIIYLFNVTSRSFVYRLSIAFIVAGAVGNLIDRVFYGVIFGYAPLLYGRVVDFINIDLSPVHSSLRSSGHYVFNIADLAVTCGVVLLLYALHVERKEEIESQKVENLLAEEKE